MKKIIREGKYRTIPAAYHLPTYNCFVEQMKTEWKRVRSTEVNKQVDVGLERLRSLGSSPGITHKTNSQNRIFLHHSISFFGSLLKRHQSHKMYKISMQWDDNSSFGSRTFNVASCRNAVGCSRIFCLLHLLEWRSSWQLQRQTISHYNKAGILPLLQTSLFISSRRLIKENLISKCSINVRSNGLVK